MREAKAVDPEWLAAEDAKRAAGSRRRSKDKAAERSLRDRVRQQFGMPEWRAATDPKVRAQELGIDPSCGLKGVRGREERMMRKSCDTFCPLLLCVSMLWRTASGAKRPLIRASRSDEAKYLAASYRTGYVR